MNQIINQKKALETENIPAKLKILDVQNFWKISI